MVFIDVYIKHCFGKTLKSPAFAATESGSPTCKTDTNCTNNNNSKNKMICIAKNQTHSSMFSVLEIWIVYEGMKDG